MDNEASEALKKFALELGVKMLEQLPSYLDPEKLLQAASELLGAETANQIRVILEDSESGPMLGLINRLSQDLDADKIIETIANPLAEQLALVLEKENWDRVISAIMEEIDTDSLIEMVAEKIADRIQLPAA